MELVSGVQDKRITIREIASVLDDSEKFEDVLNCLNIKNTDDFINSEIYKRSKDSKLKRKIYQRLYYLVSNDKIFKNISRRDFSRSKPSTNMELIYNLPLIIIISSYLIYESHKFFIYFGFEKFWALLLPFTIEMVILRLGLKSGLKSKILAYLLILFNAFSFSYYSYQVYCSKVDKINEAKIYNASLADRRNAIDLEIKEIKAELGKMNSVYRDSLGKGYISSSAKSIAPRIAELEREIYKKSERFKNLKIMPHESYILTTVSIVFVVFLKLLLQFCSILLTRMQFNTYI